MSINLFINCQKIAQDIVGFIKKTLQKTGFNRIVVGLSGGIDSAVATALAVKALGAENIFVGLLPYDKLNKECLEDAQLIIDKLAISSSNIHLIDIKSAVDIVYSSSLSTNARDKLESRSLRRGNIMARIRMILLYDLAKKHQCLVLGTENKTEHLLGYFTRFGDEASDLEPIRHLYKTQVRQLAAYLDIPEKIIKKAPTAGLWQGQTDEGEFGFSYKEADEILHLFVDLTKSKSEIIKMGFKKEIVDRVIKRLTENKFKHQLPWSK